MDRVYVTLGSLNIDVAFVLVDLSSYLILIGINDLTALAHSERVSLSSFSRFVYCLA